MWLWVLVFLQYRKSFKGVLAAKPAAQGYSTWRQGAQRLLDRGGQLSDGKNRGDPGGATPIVCGAATFYLNLDAADTMMLSIPGAYPVGLGLEKTMVLVPPRSCTGKT
jgi:hypothetical protein